jgi:glycine dehydrogenase
MDVPHPHILAELTELEENDSFVRRHIGPSEVELAAMLHAVGATTLDDVAGRTIPAAIRYNETLRLPPPIDEAATIAELRALAAQNAATKSLIGMGYHGTVTPPVILRNVLENPGWYTAYTPYQAEIAQGRLEALLNFQTLICELTGMQIANASLLDEATAAAEAMAMAHALSKSKSDVLAVATDLHPQTMAVLATRAKPLGITLTLVSPGDLAAIGAANPFALLLQYPGTTGALRDLSEEIDAAHEVDALAIVATDPLVQRSDSASQWDLEARTPGFSRLARPSSAPCPAALSGYRWMLPACPRCAWRCRPASSISAAKKRPPTSAPHRCCWR